MNIEVTCGDITKEPCDLLILKHADGFHGVDRTVSQRVGFSGSLPEGTHTFVASRAIPARKILFLGVGSLAEFRYEKIRSFAGRALGIASEGEGSTELVCSPVHGPNNGLDDREALLSLVAGIEDAIKSGLCPKDLNTFRIVEINPTRAKRFQRILADFRKAQPTSSWEKFSKWADWGKHIEKGTKPSRPHDEAEAKPSKSKLGRSQSNDLLIYGDSFGAASEKKPKLFVAMPFADDFSDVWDIAIQEACHSCGIICERINEEAFVGDIVSEIKRRVEGCDGLIALLDRANPNVFLELGFAWGVGRPTVLLSKEADKLPFDVRGQRCLIFKSIAHLRALLTSELERLKASGIFTKKL